MKLFHTFQMALATCGFILSLMGCGEDKSWHAKLVPATGKVTVNGEIPKGGIVKLFSTQGDIDARASRPSGIVTDEGTYTLTTYDYGDGAPPGEYTFTLYWPENPLGGGMSPDRLGTFYATPKTSPLKITVKEDGSPLDDVIITGAKVKPSNPNTTTTGPSSSKIHPIKIER